MSRKLSIDFPEDLYYLSKDIWINEVDIDTYALGITDFLQKQLGDLVGIVTPQPETMVQEQEEMLFVEGIKTDKEILAPAPLMVKKVNEGITRNPELINENPYDNWIIEIKFIGVDPRDLIMSLEDVLDEVYEEVGFVEEEPEMEEDIFGQDNEESFDGGYGSESSFEDW